MKHHTTERPALLTGSPSIFRQISFPLRAFDYLKEFQRGYEALHGVSLSNNQAVALILEQHQRWSESFKTEERGVRKDDPAGSN